MQLFLMEGGFTAINEKEIKKYEQSEQDSIKKLELVKRSLQAYHLKKVLAGITFATEATLILIAKYQLDKNSHIRHFGFLKNTQQINRIKKQFPNSSF